MSEEVQKQICGVIMPISAIDGCTESHWGEVLQIVTDAVDEAGFEANIVSNADDVGIIQKRIIQNLYDNPIVVCDVSGKNPNVMFELGLRLAFDKPTIIIKDDKTTYSFDTAAIEHLEYPRDLRFSKITEFKQKLKAKIIGTYDKSVSDPNYTPFLKHFGEFTVAKIDKKEIPGQDFIIEELKSIRQAIAKAERSRLIHDDAFIRGLGRALTFDLTEESEYVSKNIISWVKSHPEINGWGYDETGMLVIHLHPQSTLSQNAFRKMFTNRVDMYRARPKGEQSNIDIEESVPAP